MHPVLQYLPPLILASASPRRADLLRQAGLRFIISPSHIDESYPEPVAPEQLVCRAAYGKALSVATHHPNALILGADTVVVFTDQILGKPTDAEQAIQMLRMLSDAEHRVITGVCLLHRATDYQDTWLTTTRVRFRCLTDDEILWYVRTGEPLDKAGAYGIQGQAAGFVTELQGSYTNVVGLPVAELMVHLQRFVAR